MRAALFFSLLAMSLFAVGSRSCLLCLACVLSLAACDITDECGPFENRFRTTDFITESYRVVPGDSLDPRPGIGAIESDSLLYSTFGISMRSVPDYYFSEGSGGRSRYPTFSLVSAAHACSPAIPSSDEVVRGIRITSGTAYRTGYPAGSDLAELFDVLVVDGARRLYYERFGLIAYLADSPNAAEEIVLIPNTPPDTATEFAFTIEYSQEGSGLRSYEFVTETITLTLD